MSAIFRVKKIGNRYYPQVCNNCFYYYIDRKDLSETKNKSVGNKINYYIHNNEEDRDVLFDSFYYLRKNYGYMYNLRFFRGDCLFLNSLQKAKDVCADYEKISNELDKEYYRRFWSSCGSGNNNSSGTYYNGPDAGVSGELL